MGRDILYWLYPRFHRLQFKEARLAFSFFRDMIDTIDCYEEKAMNSFMGPLHRSNVLSYNTILKKYLIFCNTLDTKYIPLNTLVIFSFFLFSFMLIGLILSRSNLIIFLLFSELFFFSIIFLLIIFSIYFELFFGQVYTLFLLGVAAAEAAIGLGLLLVVYRIRGYLSFK